MALQIPPGFGQFVGRYQLSGDPEPIVNTIGVRFAASPNYQDAVNALDVGWITSSGLRGQVSNQYTYLSSLLYVGQDGGPPLVFESSNTAVAGLGAGAPLPQNCAVLITKRTASAGRRNKGRWFVPGIGEGAVDQVGVIQPATVTAFQAAATATFTAMASATGVSNLVVLHAPGVSTLPPPTDITSLRVESRIATRRTRMRK